MKKQTKLENEQQGPHWKPGFITRYKRNIECSLCKQILIKWVRYFCWFSLLLAVRGDMPSRDEDNSDQKDRSFNPLLGDDRSCQGAVGGDIDGNDTASSINNDNGM